jgi:hypothetical protein
MRVKSSLDDFIGPEFFGMALAANFIPPQMSMQWFPMHFEDCS